MYQILHIEAIVQMALKCISLDVIRSFAFFHTHTTCFCNSIIINTIVVATSVNVASAKKT